MISNDLVRGAMEAALVVAIKDPAGSPKALQPFLKFQKMPARAMPVVRKVLDTDDAFRERVASVVTLDMLDRPAVLFLTRPDGWEDELERLAADEAQAAAAADEEKAEKSAQRRLKAAETARTKAEERVKELTVEVERVRTLLDQERVARRQSETTAHNVTWDVDNLRKQVRELEAAAEGWASEREALLAARRFLRAAARTPCEPPPAPDLSGVVTALHDARGALDAATRSLDDAIRTVPETGGPEAHEPLAHDRRIRPAKHTRRPEPLPGGLHDDSDDAARYLVVLRHVVVVVDGYNVAKRGWPELPSLVEQRDRLLDRLFGCTRALVPKCGSCSTARRRAGSRRQRVSPSRVLFTPAGTTADEQILRLVPTVPRERPVVVASSDREVADGAPAARRQRDLGRAAARRQLTSSNVTPPVHTARTRECRSR